MKEILYIQAGSLANFVGTHFWNTQESYFTYDEHEDPSVFHDRSFREGVTSKVVFVDQSVICASLIPIQGRGNILPKTPPL